MHRRGITVFRIDCTFPLMVLHSHMHRIQVARHLIAVLFFCSRGRLIVVGPKQTENFSGSSLTAQCVQAPLPLLSKQASVLQLLRVGPPEMYCGLPRDDAQAPFGYAYTRKASRICGGEL